MSVINTVAIREDVLRDARYPVHQIAERLLPYLRVLVEQFHPQQVILFGSYAYGAPNEHSDVDLLVEFNRPVGYFGLFALQDYLENLLGCPVDLGTPDSLQPYIKDRVMGELIRVT